MNLWALRHAHWVQASAWPLALCVLLVFLMRMFLPNGGLAVLPAGVAQLRHVESLPGRAPGAFLFRYEFNPMDGRDADLRLFFVPGQWPRWGLAVVGIPHRIRWRRRR